MRRSLDAASLVAACCRRPAAPPPASGGARHPAPSLSLMPHLNQQHHNACGTGSPSCRGNEALDGPCAGAGRLGGGAAPRSGPDASGVAAGTDASVSGSALRQHNSSSFVGVRWDLAGCSGCRQLLHNGVHPNLPPVTSPGACGWYRLQTCRPQVEKLLEATACACSAWCDGVIAAPPLTQPPPAVVIQPYFPQKR